MQYKNNSINPQYGNTNPSQFDMAGSRNDNGGTPQAIFSSRKMAIEYSNSPTKVEHEDISKNRRCMTK